MRLVWSAVVFSAPVLFSLCRFACYADYVSTHTICQTTMPAKRSLKDEVLTCSVKSVCVFGNICVSKGKWQEGGQGSERKGFMHGESMAEGEGKRENKAALICNRMREKATFEWSTEVHIKSWGSSNCYAIAKCRIWGSKTNCWLQRKQQNPTKKIFVNLVRFRVLYFHKSWEKSKD